MTWSAINSRYVPYFGVDKPTDPMMGARTQIIAGSAIVDDHGKAPEGEDIKSYAHFGDENFDQSQARLIEFRKRVVQSLKVGDATDARLTLGRPLHTLQDFYSHTNWVELDNTVPSQELGRENGRVYPKTPDGVRTCLDCRTLPGHIRFVDHLKIQGCRYLIGPMDLMGGPAKGIKLLCRAGTTLAWPVCDANLDPALASSRPQVLTSGYFGVDKVGEGKPLGRCSHGGPFDRAANGTEGIRKDTANPFLSPHWYRHGDTVDLATKATIHYLDDIKSDLCDGDATTLYRDTLYCPELKLLYGVGPTLSFVIDTTGSMFPIIPAVKQQAIEMLMLNAEQSISLPYLSSPPSTTRTFPNPSFSQKQTPSLSPSAY
jgi:hypothetical protein